MICLPACHDWWENELEQERQLSVYYRKFKIFRPLVVNGTRLILIISGWIRLSNCPFLVHNLKSPHYKTETQSSEYQCVDKRVGKVHLQKEIEQIPYLHIPWKSILQTFHTFNWKWCMCLIRDKEFEQTINRECYNKEYSSPYLWL